VAGTPAARRPGARVFRTEGVNASRARKGRTRNHPLRTRNRRMRPRSGIFGSTIHQHQQGAPGAPGATLL
jgi:hypothetical protein